MGQIKNPFISRSSMFLFHTALFYSYQRKAAIHLPVYFTWFRERVI